MPPEDAGPEGAEKGKAAKCLTLPAGREEVPAGYFTGKAASNKVLIALRSLPAP